MAFKRITGVDFSKILEGQTQVFAGLNVVKLKNA